MNHSMGNDEDLQKIDIFVLLIQFHRQFKRTWLLLVILITVSGLAGYLKSNRAYVPMYRSSATYQVTSQNTNSNNLSTVRYYNKLTTEQLKSTFPYILKSGALSRVIAADLGLTNVPGSISASMIGDTNMIEITVTSKDAQLSHDILVSVINNYPKVASYVIGSTSLTLLDESGVPQAPYNEASHYSSLKKYIALGIIVYLLYLAFVSFTRRTVQGMNDLRSHVSVRYLGGLPLVASKKRSRIVKQSIIVSDRHCSDEYVESMEAIELRVENTMKKKAFKTLFVTSAIAGEGKTTTAVNLAMTMSMKGHKVLLIDGDLRNPSVKSLLMDVGKESFEQRESNVLGLFDYLCGNASMDEVLEQYKNEKLYLIPGGAPISQVSALYANDMFGKLINHYKEEFDFVIIDTPPCTFMHDTSLIVPQIDAGLIVAKHDYAPIERVLAGIELLGQSDTEVIGIVMNGVQSFGGQYGYRYSKYGYGKYGYGK